MTYQFSQFSDQKGKQTFVFQALYTLKYAIYWEEKSFC